MAVAPELHCFGRWQLDTRRRLLRADGKPVPLNGRAFDILALLVARQGELVTRDEIVAHVWNGLVVGENNLTVQMSTLRRILGEGADGAPLIVTVPGRGYKFTGAVLDDVPVLLAIPGAASQELEQRNPLPPQQLPFWQLIAEGGMRKAAVSGLFAALLCIGGITYAVHRPTATAPRLSIAVLPFRNLSADRMQDYLADALTDDLTTDLSHIPGSTVIARESADFWRQKVVTTQEIGRSLRVRYLVEGSFHVEGGQYHVNAQLLDAVSGAHLWASRFETSDGSIAKVRDAIVRRLATALDFQLAQIESARSLLDRPDDPDTLDLFFRARAVVDQDDSLSGLTRAQAMLERAVRLRPDFGDALAELGAMLLIKVRERDDPDEAKDYAEARRVVGQALSVSPRNARALAAQARILAIGGDWTGAAYKAGEALAIEPSSAEAEEVLATCAQAEGKFDQAIVHLQATLRLMPDNPMNKSRYMMLGYVQIMLGRTDDAIDDLQKAIAWDVKTDVAETMGWVEIAHLLLIAATDMKGDAAGARRMYGNYCQVWPNRTVWRFGALISRPNSRLIGFSHLMAALRDAGMPEFSDEHVRSDADEGRCSGDDFALPPNTLAAGQTIDTAAMVVSIRQDPPPLIIDVGRGAASPPAAKWWNAGSSSRSSSDFASEVAQEDARLNKGRPIVVMGDGTYGCMSYNASKRLIADGFTAVGWYRGGEEAWFAAKQPSEDRRPQ